MLLQDKEWKAAWEPALSRLFTGSELGPDSFVRTGWKRALVPGGLDMRDHTVAALAPMAGDDEVAASPLGAPRPNTQSMVGTWGRAFLDECQYSLIGGLDVCLYPSRSSWGVLCSPESFSVVTADDALFAAFVTRCGGEEKLRQDFVDHLRGGSVGFGPSRAAFVALLLEIAQWPEDARQAVRAVLNG